MNKIQTLIVDDEEEAREGLRVLLEQLPDFELIAVCKNGLEGLRIIQNEQVDLVFLDVQMPEVSGFDMLNSLERGQIPAVIFVTAYDHYALKAFEVHAIDYLLKPFSNERFYTAVQYAKKHLEKTALGQINTKLNALLENYTQEQAQNTDNQTAILIQESSKVLDKRLIMKSSGKIFFIPLEKIVWIEAFDYYVKIHLGDKFHLLRESMKRMENRLPADTFVRIHKSSIVNINYISQLEPYFNGEYTVQLTTGKVLKLSRSYRANLLEGR